MHPEQLPFKEPLLIVAAHPDDETIGASVVLLRAADVRLVYLTDGSPRNLAFAASAGCDSRESYAALRSRELSCALKVAEVPPERVDALGTPDQETSAHLPEIVRSLAEALRMWRPAVALTHPYEGGHPDHDSAAFALQAACALVPNAPEIFEFTSYHAEDGEMITGRFLPPASETAFAISLSAEERALKRTMLECFASQREMLSLFSIEEEQFRAALRYDFTRPPHAGELLYERFGWGDSGAHWRQAAALAIEQLAIREFV